ncbi:hypothetical protein YC2023_075018 [Brassica napus]
MEKQTCPSLDGAAKGLGLAATVDVVRGKAVGNEANACDNILQPMMKLAICCAVKGVVTSKVGKRATETSSEGSSMDGGGPPPSAQRRLIGQLNRVLEPGYIRMMS